ncbi:asparaginase [Nocardia sp. CNY236]|uniref:asparaginase n=1 Tax=Nocardia sp. CNY236 TaxID=1169152 RepID=UPI0005662675|nr:asparaginase [Nocardia sp. CNY236]
MPTAEPPRRVTVFALGGTIAMGATAETGGAALSLSAEQLLAAVPGSADTGVGVDVVDFRRVPSAALRVSDISALAAAIRDRARDTDGVVVIQGTDTIEETAYLLDLLHAGVEPIVVTGAMRNPTLAGADGPANILAAIHTAAHPDARGQGCLVVFNDEIHAARRVRKTHTISTATFRSPNGGPLGYLVEGVPRFLNRLAHRTVVPADPGDDIRVALVPIVLGDDGTTVRAVADHVDGLVIAGLGGGHVPPPLVEDLEALAARIPVVLASRTAAGSVLRSTYEFAGSERDLLARGLVCAGYLDALKARILLHTLLTARCDSSVIRTAFEVAGATAAPGTWPWTTGG